MRERLSLIAITVGVVGSVAGAAVDVMWMSMACVWLALGGWVVGEGDS